MYEFDWSSIPGALPFLWDGMKISLVITFQAVVIGIVWGTILAIRCYVRVLKACSGWWRMRVATWKKPTRLSAG